MNWQDPWLLHRLVKPEATLRRDGVPQSALSFGCTRLGGFEADELIRIEEAFAFDLMGAREYEDGKGRDVLRAIRAEPCAWTWTRAAVAAADMPKPWWIGLSREPGGWPGLDVRVLCLKGHAAAAPASVGRVARGEARTRDATCMDSVAFPDPRLAAAGIVGWLDLDNPSLWIADAVTADIVACMFGIPPGRAPSGA